MQTINEPIRLRPEDGGDQEPEHRCEDVLSAVTEAQILEMLGSFGEVRGLLLQVLSTSRSAPLARPLAARCCRQIASTSICTSAVVSPWRLSICPSRTKR